MKTLKVLPIVVLLTFLFLTTSGAKAECPLEYGKRYYIQNAYNNWESYLDTCGGASCGGNMYRVITSSNPDRAASGTGTWEIISASGKPVGSVVYTMDPIYLKNLFGSGTYLDTCGAGSCGDCAKYDVSTSSKMNRAEKSGTWRFVSSCYSSNTVYSLETQFKSMPSINNKLAFNIPSGIDFGSFFPCKHFQGMARVTSADGKPYFFLTKSGTHTGSCSSDKDSPGELWIVKLGSRPSNGEVLGSNRQPKKPPTSDSVVLRVIFDGTLKDKNGNTWPGWGHPGGVQLEDNVLAVALHSPSKPDMPKDGIMLIDLEKPETPVYLKTIPNFSETVANAVGVTQIPYGKHKGKYLFVIGGSGNPVLTFGVSSGNNLSDPNLGIKFCCQYNVPSGKEMLGESINLVKDKDGTIYLISFSSYVGWDNNPNWGENKMWLFKVQLTEGDKIGVSYIHGWKISKDFGDYGDVNAAACAYASPAGRLILYSACHSDYCQSMAGEVTAACRDGYVKMGEFSNDVDIPIQGTGYAEVFEDKDYKKKKLKLDVGIKIPDLRNFGDGFWNDRISSVKIYGEVTLILYENENYGGKKKEYPSNVADIGFWDFNDKATSLKVIPKKLN